jgi:hypothetical protein
MVQEKGLAAFWETAPVMKIFNITGSARLKTRVTADSNESTLQVLKLVL